ncbi:protein cordon-bleu isoform X3 [Melanotaenia boesemani]|nr:protein cordon-bleu isoform X3 [Melanotaenia boesemani]XP_041842963.1 protein cordon-bleu isoform X3 [Melanotaenia boesemani]
MKAHAPPPPQVPQPAPRHIFRSSVPDGGRTSAAEAKENILRPTVDLQLTLPQGNQISVTEDGSKALMDLLVELCSCHHLNPALHTLELLSPEGHPLGFKPNVLLGSLNVACILIKEKVLEEKVARRPAPKVPEKTVRLMVNYHVSQKAVVRVNPLAPLQALIPVICNKCEFDPERILLLKDSISRHELPMDKSLTELGIKELYVHDQSLAFQPKMASAPALNYSDTICSSTASLGRPQKKGFRGIFQFSSRKFKTETSMDMDDCDDRINQNTDTHTNGLSTVSGIHSTEVQPGTLGQSQSVVNIPRMSSKNETKKRRAPAPPGALTPSTGHTSFEISQVGLGSESQQRKRKAPAPPPTPTSITQDSDDTSTLASPTPDSHTERPAPACRTKVAQSTTASDASVVVQTVKPSPLKIAIQPPPVCHATPTASSPSPSSSTTDSLAVQDSSSELSHSFDDSDADLEQAGSHYSTSSSANGSVQVRPTTTSTSSRMVESTSSTPAPTKQDVKSDISSRSDTESALNLKLDEVENNRHSAIGNSDRPVPPKPCRSPTRESPQHVPPPTLSVPPSSPSPVGHTDSISLQDSMEMKEAAPQSWLHSMQSSTASGQKQETKSPETLSLDSSSSGSSLRDNGFTAGMAEGEDSGIVSSLSDTQPTSPEGSLSLDGRSGGEKLMGPQQDISSDSDEGCATWGSMHRHNVTSTQAQSFSSKDDSELTNQLHQTLADFEGKLADHVQIVSGKESLYTISTSSDEVPVSVVDMDVPVTAIDEVLEEYEHNIVEHEVTSPTRTEAVGSEGSAFCQSNVESQNKNNNAYTAAVSDKRSTAYVKQLYQSEQHSTSWVDKSTGGKKEEKILEVQMKEMSFVDTRSVKEDKQTLAVKSNVDLQKDGKNAKIIPDPVKSKTQSFQVKKPDPPPAIRRTVSTEKDEMDRGHPGYSSSNSSSGKITPNVTSRFGMKTFTVVPPKPSIMHDGTSQSAVTVTPCAIKIDDQGNMVRAGLSHNNVKQSSKSEINDSSPLHEKAKAFWSSNEKQENAGAAIKGLIDKTKDSVNGLDSAPAGGLEATLRTSNTEHQKTQSTVSKPAEMVQLKVVVAEEGAKEPVKVVNKEWAEMENKISMPKNVQRPSDKPSLPPPLLPEFKRDLSFLKPSRRTSSQYVASAISKYTPKSSAKPSNVPKVPDFSPSTITEAGAGFQRRGRSVHVTPLQSTPSSLSDNKENVSTSTPNPPGPKRSVSYPEHVSDTQRSFGEMKLDRRVFENCAVSSKGGSSDMLDTETAKNNHCQSNGSTQIRSNGSNSEDHFKHVRPRSPSPATNSPLHSLCKPPTAPKITSQSHVSGSKDTTKAPTHLTPDDKLQPSVPVSHSDVTPGPPAVTVFGPIKKVKPVIYRSVEKETSLHSNLMEAILTGGGKDRLKKISASGPSKLKKATYVEEENERSALLAAIRAQSNTGRLRKTKSEAANELEEFRKATSDEERSASSSSSPPSLTCSSPAFVPPPPPPVVAPPPPPPVLPLGKPSTLGHPNANAAMNPALAREAMLEAIRSGSAAERLKKVSVPTKTVQVNGRLGTIQATSSTVSQR